MKIKIRCAFLTIILCLLTVTQPLILLAETHGYFDYEIYPGTQDVVITAYRGNDASVIVPGTINHRRVVAIGDHAFAQNASLSGITLPEGIREIGKSAFSGCEQLTALALPSSLQTLGEAAFSGCTRLTKLTIPDNVEALPASLLAESYNLAELTIGRRVSNIADTALDGCTQLKSISVHEGNGTYKSLNGVLYTKAITELVKYPARAQGAEYTLPETVTKIWPRAFELATKLTYIRLPNALTRIGAGAFSNCRSLRAITLPGGITEVADHVFYGCSSLSYISLPNKTVRIGESAFYQCASLTYINFPSTLQYIGNNAFGSCRQITDASIPATVSYIGDGVFSDCSALKYIRVNGSNRYYTEDSGVLLNANKTRLIAYPAGMENQEYTLPNTVTEIADYAFFHAVNLRKIALPNTLRTIGAYAFASCEQLQEIAIPNSATTMKEAAFSDCYALEKILLPESVEHIGNWVFNFCSALTIYCYNNSPAYYYALSNDIPFSLILPDKSIKSQDGRITVTLDAGLINDRTTLTYLLEKSGQGTEYVRRLFGEKAVFELYRISLEHTTTSDRDHVTYAVDLSGRHAWTTNAFSLNPAKSIKLLSTVSYGDHISFLTRSLDYVLLIDTEKYPMRGDMDKNFSINPKDGTLLLRYLANWKISIQTKAADVDGDGRILPKDGTVLLRYLAGWDIVLK